MKIRILLFLFYWFCGYLIAEENAFLLKKPASHRDNSLTCMQCHQAEHIEELISAREAKVDFSQLPVPEYTFVTQLGGRSSMQTTEAARTSEAYAQPLAFLTDDELALHFQGDAIFDSNFSIDKSKPLNGLGPFFNDNSCGACHPKDGRGNVPQIKKDEQIKLSDSAIFLKLSIENNESYQGEYGQIKRSAENLWGSPTAVPGFGTQLFQRAAFPIRKPFNINGQPDLLAYTSGLADVWLSYETKTVAYHDGTQITLKKPTLSIDNPFDYPDDAGEFNSMNSNSRLAQSDIRSSPRIAMPIFGLGLIDAIAEKDILANVNLDARINSGITGKANYVLDHEKLQACLKDGNCDQRPPISLGRFGWKAANATIDNQTFDALRNDMGVSNRLQPDESIVAIMEVLAIKDYTPVSNEAQTDVEDALSFYAKTLAVPVRVIDEADKRSIQKGAQLFEAANCSSCHTPKYTTRKDYPIKSLANQTIYPFSDFLLHDMGDELADNRRSFEANGREWRTPPLWGIGRSKLVNPKGGFLHDGRAATIEEAILWHGGEAAASKAYFMHLSKENRNYLLQFLNSL